MSLILEALRKSEAERRRGGAPDLLQAEVLVPAAPSRRWRAWHLALPLLLLPLLWWRFGMQRQDPAPPAQAQAPSVVPPVAAAPAAEAAAEAAPETPLLEPVARLAPPPAPAPTRDSLSSSSPAPATAAAAPAPPPDAGGQPVPLGALPPDERKALPPLQISMHLWNEEPSRRLVIVDGRRVVAGDRLGDAVVAAIRRDGVLLEWRGRQVLVPLP